MNQVAIHPEVVPSDACALRWVTAAGIFRFVGEVECVPDALQFLINDGTLTRIEVEPTAVRTYLGAGRTWRIEGARVRTATVAALGEPGGWVPQQASDPDDVVGMAVAEVIAVDVGNYIRSHGGGGRARRCVRW